MKILHITESYGGGVTSAIDTYVSHSDQFEHYLFACVRDNDKTGEEGEGGFKKTYLVKRNLRSLLRLRSVIAELKPDVLHLHSTYAGFFVRLMPYIERKKVVYTPHAFAFLRNQNPLLLKMYFYIEKLLARRTHFIAGCGRDEMLIAQDFMEPENTFELINICAPIKHLQANSLGNIKPVIAMLGRVSDQKGYDFFAEVAKRLQAHASLVWIGGGDSVGEDILRNAGVNVTGWADRSEVLKKLMKADLYFHTAAWDGFPISVLEAAEFDKPIILRDIGPFAAEGLNTVLDIDDAVKEILCFLNDDPNALARAHGNAMQIKSYHSPKNLQRSLDDLYIKFESVVK